MKTVELDALDAQVEDGEPLPSSLQWDSATYILKGSGRCELGAEERTALGRLAARFPLLR